MKALNQNTGWKADVDNIGTLFLHGLTNWHPHTVQKPRGFKSPLMYFSSRKLHDSKLRQGESFTDAKETCHNYTAQFFCYFP